MHMVSPIPDRLMEAISVVFLPLFLGTLPYARSPLGARDLRRSMEVCMPLSSTKMRRLTSKREDNHRHSPLSPSSRSEATFDFFSVATGQEGALCYGSSWLRRPRCPTPLRTPRNAPSRSGQDFSSVEKAATPSRLCP